MNQKIRFILPLWGIGLFIIIISSFVISGKPIKEIYKVFIVAGPMVGSGILALIVSEILDK